MEPYCIYQNSEFPPHAKRMFIETAAKMTRSIPLQFSDFRQMSDRGHIYIT